MADNEDAVAIRLSDVLRIDRMLSWFERFVQIGGGGKRTNLPPQPIRYYGKVSTGSSLTASTLTSPSTTLIDVWIPDGDSVADPPPFVVTTDADLIGMKIVNRSSMVGTAGTMVKIEYIQNEWSVYWADC